MTITIATLQTFIEVLTQDKVPVKKEIVTALKDFYATLANTSGKNKLSQEQSQQLAHILLDGQPMLTNAKNINSFIRNVLEIVKRGFDYSAYLNLCKNSHYTDLAYILKTLNLNFLFGTEAATSNLKLLSQHASYIDIISAKLEKHLGQNKKLLQKEFGVICENAKKEFVRLEKIKKQDILQIKTLFMLYKKSLPLKKFPLACIPAELIKYIGFFAQSFKPPLTQANIENIYNETCKKC